MSRDIFNQIRVLRALSNLTWSASRDGAYSADEWPQRKAKASAPRAAREQRCHPTEEKENLGSGCTPWD